jgi:hypothetical protein
MIDINNATLTLEQRSSPRFAMTIFRGVLELHADVEVEKQFAESHEEVERVKTELKGNLQEQIYGELIEKFLASHNLLLQAGDALGPPMYERVRSSLDEVRDLLRLHKIPFSEPTVD